MPCARAGSSFPRTDGGPGASEGRPRTRLAVTSRPEASIPAVRRELWLLAAYALANLALLLLLRPAPNADWATAWWPLESWGQAVYDHPWRYSPLLIPVLGVIVFGGPISLGVAHAGGVGAAGPPQSSGWCCSSASASFFWIDLIVGNVFTFVAVAAAFAIAGSRIGALSFIALTLLDAPAGPDSAWRSGCVVHRPDIRLPAARHHHRPSHRAGPVRTCAEEWLVSLSGPRR